MRSPGEGKRGDERSWGRSLLPGTLESVKNFTGVKLRHFVIEFSIFKEAGKVFWESMFEISYGEELRHGIGFLKNDVSGLC